MQNEIVKNSIVTLQYTVRDPEGAVIDDGRLLRRFAHTTGKGKFHDLADHGVNGRALLDQAAHHQVQLPAGIAVTTIVDALLRRRAGR